jgi:hypothetical protein
MLRRRLEDIKIDTKLGCRLDLFSSEGRCEHDKEPLGLTKVWKILGCLSDYYLHGIS